jgi:proteic killer suppression protein
VIRSFGDKATEDLFNGVDSKAARQLLPSQLWRQGRRKLEAVDQAGALDDLRVPPGNRLERLKGDRSGQHSIRINDQYRICFVWSDGGADAVEVVDYH